jgi:hypothetical protein
MGHQTPHLVAIGKRNASCGSAFFACVTLTPPSSSIGICISTSGNCTSGLVGSWNWSGTVVTYPKGKKYKKIKVSFSPNPGNPTTNTFSAKKIKNTHGKAKWAENLKACEVTNPASCLYGLVGIIGA